MKNLFSFDSPLMKLLQDFSALIIINVLWLLACIPIITIGASTVALYRCINNLKNGDNSHIVQEFWKFFCNDFKQATLLFLAIVLAVILTISDLFVIYVLIPNAHIWLKILLFLPFFTVLLSVVYIYPLQANFDNSLVQTVKNAWLMSMIHFPISVAVLGIKLTPIIVFAFYPQLFARCVPIWVCLAGSIIAYASTSLLNGVFERYKNEQ